MTAVFWVCALLSVAGGFGMVFSRKAVHSALWLALTMINLAVLYVSQQAEFLGIVQVVVYTGAVMMLFLFVLMIVGVDSSDSLVETIRGHRLASVAAVLVLLVLVVTMISQGMNSMATNVDPVGLAGANADEGGNVQGIAKLLFGRYVFAFEATSALLITAALGAMVLAHRDRLTPTPGQEELSRERLKNPATAAGLPAPGVYARHNAVDTPALLPDGSVAENSLPRALQLRGVEHDVREEVATTRAAELAVDPAQSEEEQA
jgi:NADH-quinone oxidoreductase subunit J